MQSKSDAVSGVYVVIHLFCGMDKIWRGQEALRVAVQLLFKVPRLRVMGVEELVAGSTAEQEVGSAGASTPQAPVWAAGGDVDVAFSGHLQVLAAETRYLRQT